jgi:hypothetical protein
MAFSRPVQDLLLLAFRDIGEEFVGGFIPSDGPMRRRRRAAIPQLSGTSYVGPRPLPSSG